MPLFDPKYATRRWLKLGLTIGGALAGAIFGIVLTRLGKIAGGAGAIVVGIPWLVLVLPPVGLVLGFTRLARRYPDSPAVAPRQRSPNSDAG